jgi:hypothetical protein
MWLEQLIHVQIITEVLAQSSQKLAFSSWHYNFVCSKMSVRHSNKYNYRSHFPGVGNVTAAAEFNFYCDPEAAYVVIHNMECPVTIFPWEAVHKYGNISYVSTMLESRYCKIC